MRWVFNVVWPLLAPSLVRFVQMNYYWCMQTKSRTLTERARRLQIVEATIEVLAERGARGASFARVAAQAGLSSPGLISYHFEDRTDLLESVLEYVENVRVPVIEAAMRGARNSAAALRATLTADLETLAARPQLFAAVVEAFHELRDTDGRLQHLGARSAAFDHLLMLLHRGQRSGEFSRSFDPESLALLLDGARTQFLAQLPRHPDLDVEQFTRTLVDLALLATSRRKR